MELEISFVGEKRYLNQLLADILEAESFGEGTNKEIDGGASLTLKPMELKKAVTGDAAIQLTLAFGTGVVSSLVAAYLYDKLKKHKAKEIRTLINRREIQITQSGLVKIIEEHVEFEEKR